MNSFYMRVKSAPPQYKIYGDKIVTEEQAAAIADRLSRGTHTTASRREALKRYPSGVGRYIQTCKRVELGSGLKIASAQQPGSAGSLQRIRQRLSDRDLHRLVRRLATPTFSSKGHTVKGEAEREDEQEAVVTSRRRPESTFENQKRTMDKYTRPTRAHSAKAPGFRAYKPPKKVKEYDPLTEKLVKDDWETESDSDSEDDRLEDQIHREEPVKSGQVTEIVERVRSATHAHRYRSHPFESEALCDRHRKSRPRAPSATALYIQHPNLPLVAGLPRTGKHDDIFERNYRPSPNVQAYCMCCKALATQ